MMERCLWRVQPFCPRVRYESFKNSSRLDNYWHCSLAIRLVTLVSGRKNPFVWRLCKGKLQKNSDGEGDTPLNCLCEENGH